MTTTAAVVAAVLFIALAVLQLMLAFGAPFGRIVWGGTHPGKLPPRHRAASAVAALILVLAAMIVLARAGVLSWSPIPTGVLGPATWLLVGLMGLSSVGNFASRSDFERRMFGPTAAVLAGLCAIVALNGSG